MFLQVLETNGPKELNMEGKKFTKVSIFMNVFDCHVNRAPCSGKVNRNYLCTWNIFKCFIDKASEDNERKYYKITNSAGEDIIVVQIAGINCKKNCQ